MIGFRSTQHAVVIADLTRWKWERRLALSLFALAFGALLALLAAPWQQNAVGTGEVIAFSPNERVLEVQAPVPGTVVRWNFVEGDRVQRGEVIVELADNDPQVLERYRRQRAAVVARIEVSERSIDTLTERIASLRRMRDLTLEAAEAKVAMAASKAEAEKLKLAAAKAKHVAATLQIERVRRLTARGLESQREFELARRNALAAAAEVEQAQAALEAARATTAARRAARESKSSEMQAKIADAQNKLFEKRAELTKSVERFEDVERALARQSSLLVRAPHTGMLLEVTARERSHYVKQGDKLAVVIPEDIPRAAEIFVSGNDAPLIVAGQEVQLQFEGWPAIQLGGWPEAAVGTFSGEVAFVEAQASEDGRFRVVTIERPHDPWPDADVLRQGNAVNGWVLLNEVPLGYELWRKLNGFPPDLPEKAARKSGYSLN